MSLSISTQILSLRLRLYKSNPTRPLLYHHTIEQDNNGRRVFRELTTLDEVDEKAQEIVSSFLRENLKHMAFVRYVEAWLESLGMDIEIFKRAISGTEQFGRSFAGMLGSMNGFALTKSGQKWEILDESKLYPEVKKMPKEGIENIRAIARERKKRITN